MIFLGLVVAAVAVGAGAGILLDNTAAAQLTLLDHTVPGVTATWQVFAAGVVIALIFMGGMIVASVGLNRAVRVRRELRDLRDEHEVSLTTLEMEKRQLQRELARVRSEQPQPTAPAQPPAHTSVPAPRHGTAGNAVASSPFFDRTS